MEVVFTIVHVFQTSAKLRGKVTKKIKQELKGKISPLRRLHLKEELKQTWAGDITLDILARLDQSQYHVYQVQRVSKKNPQLYLRHTNTIGDPSSTTIHHLWFCSWSDPLHVSTEEEPHDHFHSLVPIERVTPALPVAATAGSLARTAAVAAERAATIDVLALVEAGKKKKKQSFELLDSLHG